MSYHYTLYMCRYICTYYYIILLGENANDKLTTYIWFTTQIVLTLEAEELFPTVIRRRLIARTKEVYPNKLGLYHWFADAWGSDRWDSVDNIRKHTQQELVCG